MNRSARRCASLLALITAAGLLLSAPTAALAQAATPAPASAPASAPAAAGSAAGADKSTPTRALEFGARLLQGNAPAAGLDIHLVGLHPMKDAPEQQMLAHHYCRQVNEDLLQCALFDGAGREARLTGVEYIVSEKLFESLPAAERAYWHPHNAEILSGQLVAPGLPAPAEHALMKTKVNSYGKTWHLWNTGAPGEPGDALPLGPPMLAWSFNREGEAQPALLERHQREQRFRLADKRRQRADLQPLAHPQSGVDALNGRFGRPTEAIPGVVDPKGAAPR